VAASELAFSSSELDRINVPLRLMSRENSMASPVERMTLKEIIIQES